MTICLLACAAFLMSGCASSVTAPDVLLNSLSCASADVPSPGTANCEIDLTRVAPKGGIAVQVTSSNSTVSVPPQVLVPAGRSTAGFDATVSSGLSAQTVELTTNYHGEARGFKLNITASEPRPALAQFSCTASSLASPGSDTCSVSLSGTAPAGGSTIQLSSSNSGVSLPGSVVVPAGRASASFDISASAGLATQVVTLTATLNQASQIVQLQVQSAPPVVVAVTPSNVSLKTGAAQQFTASVSGTSNTAVAWAVSGSGCGGAACGTITSSGLYTAPAAVPSPASVTVSATSQQDTTKTSSASIVIAAASKGTTYYIAPASAGGNDLNGGLSENSPWLTPNHSVNCGDELIALSGVYASGNFYNGKWGKVSCPGKNNVAWVKCIQAFTCSITDTSQADMFISNSYWGVQGFVFSTTAGLTACVSIAPPYSTGAQIDHIIVANNIVGPCTFDGISTNNGYGTKPTTGVDYVAYIGNVVHDTGGNSASCAAGLSFYSPVASDSAAGTHYYMAGNFAWGNKSNCGDAEGIIFDTIDGVEAGWQTSATYARQMVAENNITVFNNGPGIQVDLNKNGAGPWAPIYFVNNTSAYNCLGPSNAGYCAEIVLGTTVNANSEYNLVVAPTRYAFGGSQVPHYGSEVVYAPSSTNHISNEFAYSAYGNDIGNVGSTGFVPGPNNITSIDPGLTSPARPATPNCSAYDTTAACMAPLIADFAPTNPAARMYGYQTPSSIPNVNPLFPSWLCGLTDLPQGLATMGCAN